MGLLIGAGGRELRFQVSAAEFGDQNWSRHGEVFVAQPGKFNCHLREMVGLERTHRSALINYGPTAASAKGLSVAAPVGAEVTTCPMGLSPVMPHCTGSCGPAGVMTHHSPVDGRQML